MPQRRLQLDMTQNKTGSQRGAKALEIDLLKDLEELYDTQKMTK